MNIVVGADHAGYEMKEMIKGELLRRGHSVTDVGAHTYDSEDDFPDFAEPLAQAVADGQAERGIMFCGSGVGATIAANKVRGVRACLCHDTYSAGQGVEHDNMNVLCLGGRVVGAALLPLLVDAFLKAEFDDSGRFRRRLDKVLDIESNHLK